MKMIYKLALIICLCMILACSTIPSKPDKTNTKSTYDFVFYSTHLSKHLYPQIKEFIKPFKRNMSREEVQIIVDGVTMLVGNYIYKNQLYISCKPLVQIFKLGNDEHIAYVLKTQISFLDKEESFRDLINTVIITKKFLVYFGYNKKQGIKKGVRI